MEQSRKRLKLASIAILAFMGLQLLRIITDLAIGAFGGAEAAETTEFIANMVLLAVTLLFMLPQLYVGIKGLRIARDPDGSKGHIVWAVILLFICILGIFDPIINIIGGIDVEDSVTSFFDILLQALFYFMYIKYARKVSQEY